ncbi:hypothetical protein [Candidatus Uabimicrobium amorphum]|uniref:Uncharacterized protein n=1 Tax=Uabimicrobium amorphum TaxID=2596890 RepID=A0A5S9ITT4_UABAM|nr:hypothetical protein [Candidatus Uabimicrobium amorphum]BBM87281.1 hypothetical protein UABAM_05684 [Candidatus Uabimicrobium amorphum]
MSDENDVINPPKIIGLFLSVFGFAVLVAIAFTPTFSGRITNLICGTVILIVSGVFLWMSKKQP